MVDTPFHRLLHCLPGLIEIIPDLRPLAFPDIFPVTAPIVLAPMHYVGKFVESIHFLRGETVIFNSLGQCSPADAIDSPVSADIAFDVQCLEIHSVRVERKKHGRLPYNLHRSHRFKFVNDGSIRHVPLACRCEASVQCHFE